MQAGMRLAILSGMVLLFSCMVLSCPLSELLHQRSAYLPRGHFTWGWHLTHQVHSCVPTRR